MPSPTQEVVTDNTEHHKNEILSSLGSFTTSAPCTYLRNQGISIYDLSLASASGQILFHSSDPVLTLKHGSITGLVGTNGAGKTSLAMVLQQRALDGFPTADELTVEYLAAADDQDFAATSLTQPDQQHQNDSCVLTASTTWDMTPHEFIQYKLQTRRTDLQRKIELLEQRLETEELSDADLEATACDVSELYEEDEALQESIERDIDHAMGQVGLHAFADKSIGRLSCGWRYKCRLLGALLSHPSCLLLDEPSFLDASSTEWLTLQLSQIAKKYNAMVVLISHKESLLERLCDCVWHIHSAQHSLKSYHCSYYQFRELVERHMQHSGKKLDETKERLDAADKSLKKVQQVCHKREGNFRKAIHRGEDQRFIKGKNKEAKQRADKSAAAKLKKAQDALQEVEELRSQAQRERSKALVIEGIPSSHDTIVSLQSVGFRYSSDHENDWIFQNVDESIQARDRILLQGANGAGKSTLVHLILGTLTPTEGSIVTREAKNTLYFPQTALHTLLRHHGHQTATELLLPPPQRDLEHVGRQGDHHHHHDDDDTSTTVARTETEVRSHLSKFGLVHDTAAVCSIAKLSSGQRTRLWLAREVFRTPTPSLLILDELSEQLDAATRRSLQEVLNDFDGAVLFISHDPDWKESFSCTKVWNLWRHGMQVEYPGEHK